MTDQAGAATPEDTARQIMRCLEDGCRMALEAPDGMTVSMISAKAALAAWNTRTPDTDWQPIETAPKDATIVRGRATGGSESRVRFLGSFGGGRWCYVSPQGRHAGKAYGIKEWKPLDEPPKE